MERCARDCAAGPTTKAAIKALIGLLLLAGLLRASYLSTDDFWSKDGSGVDIFPCVMSKQRYLFLLRCLRFDDNATRVERQKIDRCSNCKNSFTLGQFATIGEKLETFRGMCVFRQCIKSKPTRYGLKIFALVDAKAHYTYTMEVYTGQQADGPFKISNSPRDVVKRFVGPIVNTGRNITTSNWFSRVELAEELQRDYKLTMVGTLSKNTRVIPPKFLATKGKVVSWSQFGFYENLTLVSYLPKKGKLVVWVSSMHHDEAIDPQSGDDRETEIITFYSVTKGAVDAVNKMCASYSVSKKSSRWPLTLFYSILNVSRINAQVILASNLRVTEKRRAFLKRLALELMEEHMK